MGDIAVDKAAIEGGQLGLRRDVSHTEVGSGKNSTSGALRKGGKLNWIVKGGPKGTSHRFRRLPGHIWR